MKRYLTLFLLLTAPLFAVSNYYVAESNIGTGSGANAANAVERLWFNTLSNWSTTPGTSGKICPGDFVHIVGTIAGEMAFQQSGAVGNPITMIFEPGAKFSSPAFPTGYAISGYNMSNITIDGGATGIIGGKYGNPALANGIVECTANGTGLANQAVITALYFAMSNNLTIKNLVISNTYVRTRGTDIPSGAAISNTDINGTGLTNYVVYNCIIHDCRLGIDSDYAVTGDGNYEFSYNTIYNVNWGGRTGDRNGSSVGSNIRVHHNWIYGFTNWDGTDASSAGALHHNGWYFWAENGGSLTNVYFYNNVVDGPYSLLVGGDSDTSNHCTGGVFASQNQGNGSVFTNFYAYNNVFLNTTSSLPPANGYVTAAPTSAFIYNNTCLGTTGVGNFHTGGFGCALVMRNNIVVNVATVSLFNSVSTGTVVASNNIYYGLDAANAFSYSATSSSVPKTYAQWQGLGYDVSGTTNGTDPLVNTTTYYPPLASIATGAGVSLSGSFTTDFFDLARGSTWTIGATQLAAVINATPRFPLFQRQPRR